MKEEFEEISFIVNPVTNPIQIKDDNTISLSEERSILDESVLEIFLEEGRELIGNIKSEWNSIQTLPSINENTLAKVKRFIHTFKGSSGMIQARKLQALSHDLETKIGDIEEGRYPWNEGKQYIDISIFNIFEWVTWIQTPEYTPIFKSLDEKDKMDIVKTIESPIKINKIEKTEDHKVSQTSFFEDIAIKLKSRNINDLLNGSGILSRSRSSIESIEEELKITSIDMAFNINKVQNLLREVQINAESQISSRKNEVEEEGGDFDPLEMDRFTKLQETTRIMAEGIDDLFNLNSQVEQLVAKHEVALNNFTKGARLVQDVAMEARLIPVDTISGKLRKIVALASKETGKQVRLDFIGDSIKIDRAVLEKIVAPLEHLIRNSVVHGIENKDTRVLQGKPEYGTITIESGSKDNFIVIACKDDGAGINTEKVKSKALELGIISKNDNLTEQETNSLIFKQGFSTADSLSGLAGRGVGMDVVKTEVEQIGGQVQLTSTKGEGTIFYLEVPLTIATSNVLVVSALNQNWVLQSTRVKQVHSVRDYILEEAYKNNIFSQGRLIHVADLLSDYLNKPKIEYFNTLVEYNLGAETIYMHVDKIRSEEGVVIRPLTFPMNKVKGIGGSAFLNNGEIGFVLKPFTLLERMLSRNKNKVKEIKVVQQLKVLVVDDSLTVRKVTGDLLRNKGVQVILAKDGLDAIEKLMEVIPDIMLVDLEMPRMNGFEFIQHVRNTPEFKATPIIMITSRTGEKHQEKAKDLGVNAYIGKPYEEQELISNIENLTKKKI